jgi:hypothetical protein
VTLAALQYLAKIFRSSAKESSVFAERCEPIEVTGIFAATHHRGNKAASQKLSNCREQGVIL